MTTTEEKLLELLDGPYKELRDDNHVDPQRVLVFEEAEGTVEAVELFELPLRYPVGPGGRWSDHDLGELLKDKAVLYRQRLVAHDISYEDPTAKPACGTVVIAIPADAAAPYRRLSTRARIRGGT